MEKRPELQKAILVRIDEGMHRAIKIKAAKMSTTMSAIIRRSIRKYAGVVVDAATDVRGAATDVREWEEGEGNL